MSQNLLITDVFVQGYGTDTSVAVSVYIEDNVIKHFGETKDIIKLLPTEYEIIHASQRYTLQPGFFDRHIHGFKGADFSDGTVDAVHTIVSELPKYGVTHCMATLVSMPIERIEQAVRAIQTYQREKATRLASCNIVGIHLEGPWISHTCKGAHAEDHLKASADFSELSHILALAPELAWTLTIAPELPGAIEFIRSATTAGVKVFLGHGNAEPDVIEQALSAGAIGFTHLGNGMGEKAHRSSYAKPQLHASDIQSHMTKSACSTADSVAEVIVDGVHLSDPFVQYVVEQKGIEKTMLITDATRATGLSDGEYMLGDLACVKRGNQITLRGSSTLAGSVATMPDCIKQYTRLLRRTGKFTEENIQRAIYLASFETPAIASATNLDVIDRHQNFVLYERASGELAYSVCDAQVIAASDHLPPTKKYSAIHTDAGFFRKSKSFSTLADAEQQRAVLCGSAG